MTKDKKIDFSQIDKKILSLKPQLIKRIREAIEKEGKLNNYLIVWDQLQKIASLVIVKILKEAFPEAEFTISKSKNTIVKLINYSKSSLKLCEKQLELEKNVEALSIDHMMGRSDRKAGQILIMVLYTGKLKMLFLKV